MAWVESRSDAFRARHNDRDSEDAARVLEGLEALRDRLGGLLGAAPSDVTVILHDTAVGLSVAMPFLPVMWLRHRARRAPLPGRLVCQPRAPRARPAPAAGTGVQRPRLARDARPHAQRALRAPGRGHGQSCLPPPYRPRRIDALLRRAWLSEGAGQFLGGQTAYAQPAIARRLREGGRPAFPPGLRDATLLGGTVVDLLARAKGVQTAVGFAVHPHPQGPTVALRDAFGHSLGEIESAWRSHLARLSEERPRDVERVDM